MKRFFVCALLFAGTVWTSASLHAESMARPAMIGSGRDSVAAFLHYPEKAKATRAQAAICFYCEIGADGKPAHIEMLGPKDKGVFSTAVENALLKGRFQPAMVGGKPVPVMLGGTVFFVFHGNTPSVVVSLSTADKDKTAALGNYIQPQLIGSNAEFRRKLMRARYDAHLRPGEKPSADVLAHVDAKGGLTSTKILAESPPEGGWGPFLQKGFDGAKFIPAMNNGNPVAGEFNLPMLFRDMKDPDFGPYVGSHIKDDR